MMGLIGMLFLLSLAVTLTLAFRPVYYFDMKQMHLAEKTGYSEEEIRANYDELIDYNLSPFHEKLQFPTFPMSEEAEIHFREVKAIFQDFLLAGVISGLLWILAGIVKIRKKELRFLRDTGIFSIVIPLIAGALIAANWDWFFTTFHELVFQNDYWLFDPVTDPVILVLPDAFFLHCAVLILLLVLAGAALCLAAASRKRHRSREA